MCVCVVFVQVCLSHMCVYCGSVLSCQYYVGGGLGGTRKGAPHECIKYSGRVDEK